MNLWLRPWLLYCSPAWSGFCSAADRVRLNAFLRWCQRLGYCSRETPAIMGLFDEADKTLFGSILAISNHVLQSYLPERSLSQYNLRQRTHSNELLNRTTELNHGDFFIRMLYRDIDYYTCTVYGCHMTATTLQPFHGPFSGTTRVSRCQKRTSGLYGARED